MPTFSAQHLIDTSAAIFKAAGAPEDIAALVAQSLVTTNLLGHDSHGVIRVKQYITMIEEGRLHPAQRPTRHQRTPVIAYVDGHYGFGQPAAHHAADTALEIAREYGLGCVSLGNANHIGRLGEYAAKIADAGYIGIVFTSGTMFRGWVTPFGGRERVFGTNPMAYAVPVPGDKPILLDFATAGIAQGKAIQAIAAGKPLDAGMMVDKEGKPTTDPNDIHDGGVLLPFGLHKGSGLALMMEILPTILSGHAPISSESFRHGNPTLMFALDIEPFVPREQFEALVTELTARVRRVEPGAGFDEVLLPGDPEYRAHAERSASGIHLPDSVWGDIQAVAAAYEVNIP